MKFQSHRLVYGEWTDHFSGERLNGVTAVRKDVIVEAKTVRDAMRMLRSPFNPSPIVTVVGADAQWAQRAVERLML
jgi:hypothetical protein